MGIFSRKNPWESSDPKIRLKAVMDSKKKPAESWNKLTMAIVDPDVEVRLAATEALGHNFFEITVALAVQIGVNSIDSSIFQNLLKSTAALLSSRIELDDNAAIRAEAARTLGSIWLAPVYDVNLSEADRKFMIEIAKKSLSYLVKAGNNNSNQEVKSAAAHAIETIRDYYRKENINI